MNNLEISFKSLLILSSILEKFSKSINSKILEIIFIKFSLNINKNASQEEIRSGYKKMLRKYPPEKEQEKYKEIREAYDTLKDEKSRKNYDAYFHHENKNFRR